MLKKIKQFIADRHLFTKDDNLLLAVSGGADSIALMHILPQLSYNCKVAHINHNLRKEHCGTDEKFVIDQAARLNLKAVSRSVEVEKFARDNKLSIETAGRELRLNSLIDIAEKLNCSTIITAHHSDDNIETVLHRLSRGSSFRGLAGIWPKNKLKGFDFARPLLCISKLDIMQYLTENNLSFRYDHTNEDTCYTRNWIRHKLIDHLKKTNSKNITRSISALSNSCQKLQQKIENITSNIFDDIATVNQGIVELNLISFNKLQAMIKSAVIHRVFETVNIGLAKMTSSHYRKIIDIALEYKGSVNLPCNFQVFIRKNSLVISPAVHKKLPPAVMAVPGETNYGEITVKAEVFKYDRDSLKEFIANKTSCVEWFDFDKICGHLTIRTCRKGDKITALGRNSQRKISHFTDNPDPVVVEDSEKIIWITGKRPSEMAKITSQTAYILQLKAEFTQPKQVL